MALVASVAALVAGCQEKVETPIDYSSIAYKRLIPASFSADSSKNAEIPSLERRYDYRYAVMLGDTLGVTVLATVSYAVNCVKNRGGDLSPVPGTAAVFLLLSLLPAILLMPVLFKFGVERGRILYYIMFGGMFGVAAFSGMTGKLSVTGFHPHPLLMMLIAAVLWVASMLLSQVLYPKRYR